MLRPQRGADLARGDRQRAGGAAGDVAQTDVERVGIITNLDRAREAQSLVQNLIAPRAYDVEIEAGAFGLEPAVVRGVLRDDEVDRAGPFLALLFERDGSRIEMDRDGDTLTRAGLRLGARNVSGKPDAG